MAASPDEPMHGIGDLAVALGGSEDSFTGKLLLLIAKADPGNRERIRRAFPRQVTAWERWMATSPTPTAVDLLATLPADLADHPCPACARGDAHSEPDAPHIHATAYGYVVFSPDKDHRDFIESLRAAERRAARRAAAEALGLLDGSDAWRLVAGSEEDR